MEIRKVFLIVKETAYEKWKTREMGTGLRLPRRERFELMASDMAHREALAIVRSALKKKGVGFEEVKCRSIDLCRSSDADLIISLGGDGTFISASHIIRDGTPLLGV